MKKKKEIRRTERIINTIFDILFVARKKIARQNKYFFTLLFTFKEKTYLKTYVRNT